MEGLQRTNGRILQLKATQQVRVMAWTCRTLISLTARPVGRILRVRAQAPTKKTTLEPRQKPRGRRPKKNMHTTCSCWLSGRAATEHASIFCYAARQTGSPQLPHPPHAPARTKLSLFQFRTAKLGLLQSPKPLQTPHPPLHPEFADFCLPHPRSRSAYP